MNLYYLNKRVNELRAHAKKSDYARWHLGELLHKASQDGYEISQDKVTGNISITEKRCCHGN